MTRRAVRDLGRVFADRARPHGPERRDRRCVEALHVACSAGAWEVLRSERDLSVEDARAVRRDVRDRTAGGPPDEARDLMDVLRTPDDALRRPARLPVRAALRRGPRGDGTDETLRVHYVDEGPADATRDRAAACTASRRGATCTAR